MVEGEYASMKELAKYNPAFVPEPLSHGQFMHAPVPTYFFLMEFVNLDTGAPDPVVFCKQLAALHQESVSPTGKFGFEVITCHGPNSQDTRWDSSWSVYFARLLRQFYERDISSNGPTVDGDYEVAFEKLLSVAVPALLDPLQAHGRELKPCLVHGDLWEENCGTDLSNGQPKVFDAAVMYAHHEYDLGMWRREVIRFGRAHTRQYLKHMAPSEPRDQWDDRNRLYSIKYELAHAIALPATVDSQRSM
jgi:protein-ribulosamine 3-kinase